MILLRKRSTAKWRCKDDRNCIPRQPLLPLLHITPLLFYWTSFVENNWTCACMWLLRLPMPLTNGAHMIDLRKNCCPVNFIHFCKNCRLNRVQEQVPLTKNTDLFINNCLDNHLPVPLRIRDQSFHTSTVDTLSIQPRIHILTCIYGCHWTTTACTNRTVCPIPKYPNWRF